MIATKTQVTQLEALRERAEDVQCTLDEIASEISDITAEIDEKIENRSERWQESEAGDEATTFAEGWRSAAEELIAALASIDFPEA